MKTFPLKQPYLVFIACSVLCFLSVYGQEAPPIRNYTPADYGAENQNWSISQDAKKHLYFANNKGLLEFNGANWNLYPTPNNSIIRSVKVIDSLIYTGCFMEFGYWKRDRYGRLRYASISDELKTPLLEDEEFWGILNYKKWVLFQSLNRIYIYDTVTKAFKIINSQNILEKIFKANNKLYFQKRNEGLFSIENGKEILVSDHAIVKNNILVGIYKTDKGVLLATQQKGLYWLTDASLKKWSLKKDVLEGKTVYSSQFLSDGSLLLGTISNGIYQIDLKGSILKHIDQKKGLNNNTVLSIFEDREKNIWLGLDNGISVLNTVSPFKIYNDFEGKIGAVYASAVFKDFLYLGTNQGLFYKKYGSPDAFQWVEGTKGQVWCLIPIGNDLFCGHNSGTFAIKNNEATLISSVPGTWNIKKIPGKKELLLQGNYDGLSVLEKSNDTWNFRNKIEGFDNSCRFFEFSSDGFVFISHEYKGVYRLKIDEDLTKIEELKIEKLKKGKNASLVKYKENVLYNYQEGVYAYDANEKSFKKEKLLSEGFHKNELFDSGKLIVTNNKRLWGFTQKNLIYIEPGKLIETPQVHKIPIPTSARGNINGFENIASLNDNTYLLGTSKGYLILNTEKTSSNRSQIHINSVSKGVLNSAKERVPLTKHAFKSHENNLDISFSVPVYKTYSELKYQYKLKGIYDQWSDWSNSPEVSLTNLPYGNYTFSVRAKIANRSLTNTANFSFTINRPWYLSKALIGLYTLLFIGSIIGTHTLYNNYYKRQKRRLIAKKQREFERTQLENEQVIMKLRNDKLRNDIESKNRELAASTMSMIKKNEFLNTLKKELTHLKNEETIKPVIKIIDKNLSQNNDWELFREAFNNADKDFLKKVKDRHPSLTPNDLKLCAYLRLNLSSKEIAPLLNISYKSVEIKRYRLRKKMGLSSKENLVNHILEI